MIMIKDRPPDRIIWKSKFEVKFNGNSWTISFRVSFFMCINESIQSKCRKINCWCIQLSEGSKLHCTKLSDPICLCVNRPIFPALYIRNGFAWCRWFPANAHTRTHSWHIRFYQCVWYQFDLSKLYALMVCVACKWCVAYSIESTKSRVSTKYQPTTQVKCNGGKEYMLNTCCFSLLLRLLQM